MAWFGEHWSGLLALAMMEPSTLLVLSGNSVNLCKPCSECRMSNAICSAVHVLFLHLVHPAMMAMLSLHPCLCQSSLRHWSVTGSGKWPFLVMHWWPKVLCLLQAKRFVDETLSVRARIHCCTFLTDLLVGFVSSSIMSLYFLIIAPMWMCSLFLPCSSVVRL